MRFKRQQQDHGRGDDKADNQPEQHGDASFRFVPKVLFKYQYLVHNNVPSSSANPACLWLQK
jgi:hypothetical protein